MKYGHNSTIGVKQKICKSCGMPSYIFSKGRCAQCSKVEDTQKRMEKETDKIIEEEDLSGLIEDADTIFSRFIRLKYANENGMVKCYTCDALVHWSMLDCGHFVKRAHLYTRWLETNCKPQCKGCNQMDHGNILVYRERLEKESPGQPEYLMDSCKLVYKPTREEIRQIIVEYTPKVKELQKKLNR